MQGYLVVRLSKKSKAKTFYIHQLVCESFTENSNKKTTVNHIDGNKANNYISNLEWNTQSEKNKHAWDSGLRRT